MSWHFHAIIWWQFRILSSSWISRKKWGKEFIRVSSNTLVPSCLDLCYEFKDVAVGDSTGWAHCPFYSHTRYLSLMLLFFEQEFVLGMLPAWRASSFLSWNSISWFCIPSWMLAANSVRWVTIMQRYWTCCLLLLFVHQASFQLYSSHLLSVSNNSLPTKPTESFKTHSSLVLFWEAL